MIEFEVGARPSRPLSLAIRDELDNPVSLLSYNTYYIEIKDTNDNPVDTTGVTMQEIQDQQGLLSVSLPKDRTLFPEKGQYLLRLVLLGSDGAKDITRAAEIRVRDFGRLN